MTDQPHRHPAVCCSLLVALLGLALPTQAAETIPPGPAARPRVALVLGGGGARGAAHIGVLEELQRLRVPVDCVAGTSMGSLVAGALAAGLTPEVMRGHMAKANWDDMFQDNPAYEDTNYRSKELARRFIPGLELGLKSDGLYYTPGVVAGEKIKLFFNRLVRADLGERSIERLPLPLAIVATDIGTGERVVFREGSLTQAMRASMAVPGLMAPAVVDGRKLVDGGLVDNLPISVARDLCNADMAIVVNVGSPLLRPEEVGSLLSVSAQMVNILTQQNVDRSMATLRPGDIVIQPDLDGIGAADFARSGETADRGRDAVAPMATRLQALAVSEAEYAAWWRGIAASDRTPPRVDAIEIAPTPVVNPAVIERHITQQVGQPLDTERLERDLVVAYGDGHYNSIDYSLVGVRDRTVLRILPVEKSIGTNSVLTSINLETSSKGRPTFDLRLGYRATWLNALGGELLLIGSIGNTTSIGAQFYQPLDAQQTWFVEPTVISGHQIAPVFVDDRRVADYLIYSDQIDLAAGVNIGLLGRAKVGWRNLHQRAEVDVGSPVLPTASQTLRGWFAELDLDQFDRLYFPSNGWSAQAEFFSPGDASYNKLHIDLQRAQPLGDYVLAGRVSWTGSPRGELPALNGAALGGFLNLSAFAPGQLVGDDVAYLQLRGERIIGRMPVLRGDLRVGMALEAGRLGVRYTDTHLDGWLPSGTVYLGGETPIGAVYIGYGVSRSGISNAYLFLGKP